VVAKKRKRQNKTPGSSNSFKNHQEMTQNVHGELKCKMFTPSKMCYNPLTHFTLGDLSYKVWNRTMLMGNFYFKTNILTFINSIVRK
jgi:hypothetical protein